MCKIKDLDRIRSLRDTTDNRMLTVRKAESLTGIAAADFSRIRRTKLDRFTIDRLMTILDRLDQNVEVSVTVRSHHASVVAPYIL